MTGETITYRRVQLYEEVWMEPVRTVASRYGVSDVALAKVCRKLQIPLPWSGYWTQVRAGQQVRRPPLPPLTAGVPSEIVTEKRRRRDSRPLTDVEPAEPPIVVPAELHDAHKLVSEASRLLRNREPQGGLVQCWGTRCLDITVAPASLGRALRIMHALIRALEKRGLQVEVTRPLRYEEQSRGGESEVPSNATRVMVADEWIQFGITEKRSVARPAAPEPPKYLKGPALESWIWQHQSRTELVPNGTLELGIKSGHYLGVRMLWHDGKHKRVEDCLNDFIGHLHLMADAIKRHRDELEQARRARQEGELRRLEREQERRQEEERVRDFEKELGCWRLARDAREYLTEIRGLLRQTAAEHSDESALELSLAWIEGFARRVDPLAQLRDLGETSATSRVQPGEREPDVVERAGPDEV